MNLDRARIEALSLYTDQTLGIRERFITPHVQGGPTVAVVSEPLADPSGSGWVMCHSFGADFDNLGSFEATLARRLASLGSSVIRFHAQGYGDSHLGADRIGLRAHVGGAIEAGSILQRHSAVKTLGFVGALFGASVAALAADSTSADALVAIQPAIDGRAFVRSRIRRDLSASLADARGKPDGDQSRTVAAEGVMEVDGFTIQRKEMETIRKMSLLSDLTSFRGRSLVLQISRSPEARPEVEELVRRLEQRGGVCTLQILADKDALRFGSQPWRQDDLGTKTNVLASLSDAVIRRTLEWTQS